MSDMRIQSFDFAAAVAKAGLRPDGTPRTDAAGGAFGASAAGAAGGVGAPAGGFRAAMNNALKEVSQAQFQAQHLQRELTLDNPTVSLEDTVMAMQKAQIGFQATLQVRNRLAQAYSDIMNMQV